ncbi:MAG: hypothetical protein V1744_02340 [Candidatus Altiarchaeota archaeon]
MAISQKSKNVNKPNESPEVGGLHDFGDFSPGLHADKKSEEYDLESVSGAGLLLRIHRQSKVRGSKVEMPESKTLAIDFGILGVEDKAGLHLTGKGKDSTIPKLTCHMLRTKQLSKKEAAEFEEAMRKVRVLNLINKARETWSARHIIKHEELEAKYDRKKGELSGMWRGMGKEDRDRIELWYYNHWGVKGEVDDTEILKQYLVEEELAGTTPASVLIPLPFPVPGPGFLTQRQTEARTIANRIGEAYGAARIVKDNLKGLHHLETTEAEKEQLGKYGYTFKDYSGNALIDISESGLNDLNLNHASSLTGISKERLNALIERQEAKEYLANNAVSFDPFYLTSAKYVTLDDLITEKIQQIKIFEGLRGSINDSDRMAELLNRLESEHRLQPVIRGMRCYRSKGVITKVSVSDRPKVSDFFGRIVDNTRQELGILKRVNPTFDPGTLLFDVRMGMGVERTNEEYETNTRATGGAVYMSPAAFGGELSKIGLICSTSRMLLESGVIAHEYKHLASQLKSVPREKLDEFVISEISAQMIQVASGKKTWDDVKRELTDDKDTYLGNVVSDVIKILESSKGNSDHTLLISQIREDYERTKVKVHKSVDVVARMQKNGLPDDTITAILLYSKDYDDILSWEKVSDEDLQKFARGMGKRA